MKTRIILLIFLLTGCTVFGKKGIISVSTWKESDDFPKEISGSHEESGINWRLMNDSKNLYIKFETKKRYTQMALMNEGFKLYFDTVKQKNKKDILVYTNKSEGIKDFGKNTQFWGGFPGQSMPSREHKENIVQKYNKAIWHDISYDLEFEITDFSSHYVLDTNDLLTCYAVVPFKIICNRGLSGISDLSVCLEIVSNAPAMNMNDSQFSGPGRGNNGFPQGPPPGDGQPPQSMGNPRGMGGPPRMGGMENPPDSFKSETLVKVWLLTRLAYHK